MTTVGDNAAKLRAELGRRGVDLADKPGIMVVALDLFPAQPSLALVGVRTDLNAWAASLLVAEDCRLDLTGEKPDELVSAAVSLRDAMPHELGVDEWEEPDELVSATVAIEADR